MFDPVTELSDSSAKINWIASLFEWSVLGNFTADVSVRVTVSVIQIAWIAFWLTTVFQGAYHF
jgi:hypothetical protein